jgi:hypothetical protein
MNRRLLHEHLIAIYIAFSTNAKASPLSYRYVSRAMVCACAEGT